MSAHSRLWRSHLPLCAVGRPARPGCSTSRVPGQIRLMRLQRTTFVQTANLPGSGFVNQTNRPFGAARMVQVTMDGRNRHRRGIDGVVCALRTSFIRKHYQSVLQRQLPI